MNIDWSKAPEGYDFHIQWNTQVSDFYRDDGDRYTTDQGYYALKSDLLRMPEVVITRRPTAPTWNGEGLPPVGTVCEVRDDLENIREVEIIAHTKRGAAPVAVYQCGDEIGAYTASLFHPIRTPEQIAAEEREKAIKAMCKDLKWGHISLAARLYDAGYRKADN